MSQHDAQGTRDVHRWLAPLSLVIVALAALMGWGASFVGLHEYGMRSMAGFTWLTAWLVPATFDGAAFACTLMTYRSSIHGRSALRGRVLMWGFTAVSSWINWIHQPSTDTKLVAAGLPVAAVAVFDVVLIELRADYEARHGRQAFRLRPGLLVLRWLVDRSGTSAAFRSQITSIPVEELAGLGNHRSATAVEAAESSSDHAASAPRVPEPRPAQQETVPPALNRGRLTLPPSMLDAVGRAASDAAAEGRQLTVADVQRVIKVDDKMAERVVTEVTSSNGHAVAA